MSNRKVLGAHSEGAVILPYSRNLYNIITDYSGAAEYRYSIEYTFYVFSIYDSIEFLWSNYHESENDSEKRAICFLMSVLETAKAAGYYALRIKLAMKGKM